MHLDLKLPRWLAVLAFVCWAASIVEGMVCQAISARANLHYLSGPGNSPPPPYPGQPNAMERPKEPEKSKDEKPDGLRRPILRPRK